MPMEEIEKRLYEPYFKLTVFYGLSPMEALSYALVIELGMRPMEASSILTEMLGYPVTNSQVSTYVKRGKNKQRTVYGEMSFE